MRGWLALLIAIFATACSRGVPIQLSVDEPIATAIAQLNDKSFPLRKGSGKDYNGKWTGGDADGWLVVVFPNGDAISCRIGYVTSGLGAQRFAVESRRCVTKPSGHIRGY